MGWLGGGRVDTAPTTVLMGGSCPYRESGHGYSRAVAAVVITAVMELVRLHKQMKCKYEAQKRLTFKKIELLIKMNC